jgi:hypothetical protein
LVARATYRFSQDEALGILAAAALNFLAVALR